MNNDNKNIWKGLEKQAMIGEVRLLELKNIMKPSSISKN